MKDSESMLLTNAQRRSYGVTKVAKSTHSLYEPIGRELICSPHYRSDYDLFEIMQFTNNT